MLSYSVHFALLVLTNISTGLTASTAVRFAVLPRSPKPFLYSRFCGVTGLVGEIIARFEKRGYKLVALKMVTPTVEHLEKHYDDLKSKGFFAGLIKYMASGAFKFRSFGVARSLRLWSLREKLGGRQLSSARTAVALMWCCRLICSIHLTTRYATS